MKPYLLTEMMGGAKMMSHCIFNTMYNNLYYTFILGNQQQVTVVFKEAEKHFHNTSRKASLYVLRKCKCFSTFQKQNPVITLH